jgi:protein-S-isoprenylcysteine O-methyltransferase Ste14
MFGIPLTIYFLSSFFGLPLTANHSQGHLLAALLALAGVWDLETGVTVVMTASIVLLLVAGYLVIAGWREIYNARETLATEGVYGVVRHPQYLGIIISTVAFLIQWPTIITVAMWPVLTYAYIRQAKKEEQELEKKFEEEYRQYKKRVPMLIPRLKPK